MKRMFDIVFSFIALVLFSPVMLMIALAIFLNDQGPVIFAQKRMGKFKTPFVIYKFRSMSVLNSAKEGAFESGENSRITSVGRVIRKTKLDELPQLFNVLKGDMSVVGPRPEVEKWVDAFPEQWERILTVRPGITDNASILFRNEEQELRESESPDTFYRKHILPRKLALYEDYVDNHTFRNDLTLIIRTLFHVITK